VFDLVDPFTVYHIVTGLRWKQSPGFIRHEGNIFIIHGSLPLRIREGLLHIIWFSRGGGMKGCKQKNRLIEEDIVRYIDAPDGDTQALKPLCILL
jgi:hypothetical protein